MSEVHAVEQGEDAFVERQLEVVEGTIPQPDLDDLTSIIRPFLIRNKVPVEDVLAYCQRTLRDYKELKSFLPENKTSILNIGCGFGAHDLYLGKHYGSVQFHLIEGTKTIPKAHSGFREDTQPYRNGNLAVRLLRANNIHARLYPVGQATSDATIPVDFVVSFCALGHHFPVHTYLPLIQRSLLSGGHLLVDIRTGTNGREQLEVAGFEVQRIIKEKPKFTRILFIKK